MKGIIIKPSFGHFEPDKSLKKLVQECGHESLWDIGARMDERIIKFIQDRTGKKGKDVVYRGKENKYGGFTYITIEKVDTSKLWILDEYDSAEGIAYIKIKDRKLNFCELEVN